MMSRLQSLKALLKSRRDWVDSEMQSKNQDMIALKRELEDIDLSLVYLSELGGLENVK